MSLEKILKKINEDAQAEARKIIFENQKKAVKIRENARKEASDIAEALLEEAEKEAQLEASRLITQARLERKIKLLTRKKELIEEVIERAFRSENMGKKGVKKKIILKDGQREEPFDQEKLKDELRPKLENYIVEVLKI